MVPTSGKPGYKLGSFGFVRFDSEENMLKCVQQVNQSPLPGNIRIAPNKSKEAKQRSSRNWDAKQILVKAGWALEHLSVYRGGIFEMKQDGTTVFLGKFIDEEPVWENPVKARIQAA